MDRPRDTLRLLTCGSVDDGKSTLIGRLLHECGAITEDQREALAAESRRFGTTGADRPDFALLLDGLQAERDQGITIDVAYRHFSTPRRAFIVADTPGHEQYTRNMATGASTADLAVLLVDARHGVLPQTRRHALIVSLMGIRQVVLAVNKMDLIDWDSARFHAIVADFQAFAARLEAMTITPIPLSALTGDNLSRPSALMPWYSGPSLLEHLEGVEIAADGLDQGFCLPVQGVCRPHQDFRGYAGSVAAGTVRPGDAVAVLPSGRGSRVERIVTLDGDLAEAGPGRAVTLTLADPLDIARGDVIAAAAHRPEVTDQFAAHLVWMAEAPMLPGRSYLLRLGTATVGAQVTELKHRLALASLEKIAAKHLDLNDIGMCNLALERPLPFAPYRRSRAMGGFILIDRLTNATVAAGMIDFALRRADNIHLQPTAIDKAARARLMGQAPMVLWFTGLSGAGKSAIANEVERRLHAEGRHTILLDGDNLRHGLNRDLGFTPEDRVENIRRAAECARLLVDGGLIVLATFISPFHAEREAARRLFADGEFVEVFIDTPLDVCERRDVKGLYAKARAGRLPNFTGIDSPYEAPQAPELRLDGATLSVAAAAERVIAFLRRT